MTEQNKNIEQNNNPAVKNANSKPATPFSQRNGERPRFNKKPNFADKKENPFEERVVAVNRVVKVTKGGRHFRFAAVVVIGDKKGRVGFATGKANEAPDAIKKAIKMAKKVLYKVLIIGTTVPHDVIGHFGAGKVMIKPAKKGTGVIAGGAVRDVIELSGLNDVYTKSLGSNTPINMIRATIDGLKQMRTAEQIAKIRGKAIAEL